MKENKQDSCPPVLFEINTRQPAVTDQSGYQGIYDFGGVIAGIFE
jgi:hypothetical protein